MTGLDVRAQALAETREAVRERERLARTPVADFLARAKSAALARRAGGKAMAVPPGLAAALISDGELREYQGHQGLRGPRTVHAPSEKTPARKTRRGGGRGPTPLGTMLRAQLPRGLPYKDDE